MMLMMPLMLGFMFYGMSSGLVLYWLTGNLVGIAQQWFFNRGSRCPCPCQRGAEGQDQEGRQDITCERTEVLG